MGMPQEWKTHYEAILVAIDKSTEPEKMAKVEALGFLNLLADALGTRAEALEGEIEEVDEEGDYDAELLEASGLD
jgi:hypothetical protein